MLLTTHPRTRSQRPWRPRSWSSLAVAAAALLVFIPSSLAAGGDTIASAPTIVPGQLQVGTGGARHRPEYWRMDLTQGDQMTVRTDFEDNGRQDNGTNLSLFSPAVDDYTLRDAQPVANHEIFVGKSEFTLTSPFTGLGTIQFCCGYDIPQALSFTITIAHLTNVLVTSAPRHVTRGHSFRISARVQSPAGTPTGACVFRPVSGRGAHSRGPVPLTDGKCTARVGAGQGRSVRYRVRFEAEEGWRDASALTRKITVQRRSS